MNAVADECIVESMLNGVDIPPCPAILVDLDNELRKDEPDQRELARLIGRDVALSGHVMQIANSPVFSPGGGRFSSLIQALNALGTRQVFSLVVGQLLKTAMSGPNDVAMERFWESSALVARISAELARRLRCVRPDVAYTFGLFHDCGIPLMVKRFPQTKQVLAEANATEDGVFTDIENDRLGTNHAVVGYFLAKRWRLPPDVVEAIRSHHRYALLATGELGASAKGMIAIGVLAEHIARLHSHGDGEQEWGKAVGFACELFGLSLGAVDDLIEDMLDWLG